MAIEIALSGKNSGKVFTCSPVDIALALSRPWYINRLGYVQDRAGQLFHILALGYADEGLEWDHIDRYKRNNCRDNLRMCTRSQNMLNAVWGTNTVDMSGVNYDKRCKRWRATISIEGLRYFLGRFKTPEEAKEARLAAEKEFCSGTR